MSSSSKSTSPCFFLNLAAYASMSAKKELEALSSPSLIPISLFTSSFNAYLFTFFDKSSFPSILLIASLKSGTTFLFLSSSY